MAEPIKPVSRLEDASLGNSNAIAEARRAASSERQAMAVERSMQRQYRRAVRKGDMQTISVLGSQMSDMGLSRTGGGGIQDSQENNRIASDRAFNRADQLNQAGGRAGGAPQPLRAQPMANPQNGAEGPLLPPQRGDGANELEATARTANPKPAGTANRKLSGGSELFEPDADLLSRPMTPVSSEDKKPAKANETLKEPALSSEPSAEETLLQEVTRKRDAFRKAKELTDDGFLTTVRSQDRTRKFKDELDSGIFDPVVEPPIARTPSAKVKDPVFKELDPKSSEYWAVDPNQITSMKKTEGEGANAYMAADPSDPRFPVMKLIQDAEVMMKDAYSSRDAKRKVYNALGQIGAVQKDEFYSDENARKQRQEMVDHEVIWRAAREGVDLTGYARHRGLQFFNDYQEAKNVQTEIKKADFRAEEIKSQAANLVPSP